MKILDIERHQPGRGKGILDRRPLALTRKTIPFRSPRCSRACATRAEAVDDFVARGEIIYGVTTGFGDFKDSIIPPDQVKQLQRNIIVSHSTGVGPKPCRLHGARHDGRAGADLPQRAFRHPSGGDRSLLEMVNSGVYPSSRRRVRWAHPAIWRRWRTWR